MSNQPLLVTGASGHLGRRVVELLLEQGKGPIIATTRNPDSLREFAARGVEVRRADFDDPASLNTAFRGAGRALLVSTDALDRPGRRAQQQIAAVRALAAAGVEHVVYTSAAHANRSSTFSIFVDHRQTEEALLATKLDSTLLRNNLYTDLFLQTLPGAVASGQLVDARANGATAFVTREDCARAAAAALASDATGRRAFDITGPAPLTSDEVAALLADITGRPIAHVSVPVDALLAGMVQHGLPAPVAELFAGFDAAIAKGDLAVATSAVAGLTGKAPTSVRDFLAAHRASLLGS